MGTRESCELLGGQKFGSLRYSCKYHPEGVFPGIECRRCLYYKSPRKEAENHADVKEISVSDQQGH